jgi:hypothetical protein
VLNQIWAAWPELLDKPGFNQKAICRFTELKFKYRGLRIAVLMTELPFEICCVDVM